MLYSVLISQILLGAVALSAPAPAPLSAGDIVLAKPKHFDNPMPNTAKIGLHPAVALTDPDEQGNVKLAPISHSHPGNPPTKPLSDFHINIAPSQGKDQPGSINVATPATVHMSNIKLMRPASKMQSHHLDALKNVIRNNCGGHVVRRADNVQPDPCDREAMARAAHAKVQQKNHPSPSRPHPAPGAQGVPQKLSRKAKLKRAKNKAAAHPQGSPNGGTSHHSNAGPSGAETHNAGSPSGSRHSKSHTGHTSNANHSGSHTHASGNANHPKSKKN